MAVEISIRHREVLFRKGLTRQYILQSGALTGKMGVGGLVMATVIVPITVVCHGGGSGEK